MTSKRCSRDPEVVIQGENAQNCIFGVPKLGQRGPKMAAWGSQNGRQDPKTLSEGLKVATKTPKWLPRIPKSCLSDPKIVFHGENPKNCF